MTLTFDEIKIQLDKVKEGMNNSDNVFEKLQWEVKELQYMIMLLSQIVNDLNREIKDLRQIK